MRRLGRIIGKSRRITIAARAFFQFAILSLSEDEVLQREPAVATHLVSAFETAKQQAYRYWADHRRSSLAGRAPNKKRSAPCSVPIPGPIRSRKTKLSLTHYWITPPNKDSPSAASTSKEIFAPNTFGA